MVNKLCVSFFAFKLHQLFILYGVQGSYLLVSPEEEEWEGNEEQNLFKTKRKLEMDMRVWYKMRILMFICEGIEDEISSKLRVSLREQTAILRKLISNLKKFTISSFKPDKMRPKPHQIHLKIKTFLTSQLKSFSLLLHLKQQKPYYK